MSGMDASAPGSRCAFPTRALACRRGGGPRAGRTVSYTGAGPSMSNVLWLTSLGPLDTGGDARAAWIASGGVKTTSSWTFPIPQFADRAMLGGGDHPFVHHILVGVKHGVLTVGFRNLRP